PWQRPPGRTVAWGELTDLEWPPGNPTRRISAEAIADAAASCPLVRLSVPIRVDPATRDRELVLRRALVQVLALRRWQLRNGGRLPGSLADLVPSELEELPRDPYSGRRFGFVHSTGQALRPLGFEDPVVKART